MYLTNLRLENIGPIKSLNIEFNFNENGTPKPILFVGPNGSGKTILLAHIVNTFLLLQQEHFTDSEVLKDRVFKIRSPNYISSGSDYSFSSITFNNEIYVAEWQLRLTKEKFEEVFKYSPAIKSWEKIPPTDSNFLDTNYPQKINDSKDLFNKGVCLYYPVNRYEEPAWLNYDDLKIKPDYNFRKNLSGFSNREIIQINPLKKNQDWILDVVLDREIYEKRLHLLPVGDQQLQRINYVGTNSLIFEKLNEILRTILRRSNENIRIGISPRRNRRICVMKDEQEWIPSVFQLSTGEVLLLNIFLSIIRDFDIANIDFGSLEDVSGIVVIDEVDAHLHTLHQTELLPKLINLFPKVQFIISTHSPLFLIGLSKTLGPAGFDIYTLPESKKIDIEKFSEFNELYDSIKETQRFQDQLVTQSQNSSKPIVFLEGTTDIKYVEKAAALLGKSDLLTELDLKDGGGQSNMSKIYKAFDNPLIQEIPIKIILIYDCDVQRADTDNDTVHQRFLPVNQNNPIKKGIENLFPLELIERANSYKDAFIDEIQPVVSKTRGVLKTTSLERSINPDEKTNFCEWVCQNGTAEEFSGFSIVFELIEGILNAS